MISQEKVSRVAFGLFEADLHTGELWKAGYKIKLPRQPFRVLVALLTRPGTLVTREELHAEIWGVNTNVDFDQAIAAAVNKIREALGDSAENPVFIQTLTKRGYRFIAPVTVMPPNPSAQESAAPGSELATSPAKNEGEDASRSEKHHNHPGPSSSLRVSATVGIQTQSLSPVAILENDALSAKERGFRVSMGPQVAWWSRAKFLYLFFVAAALVAGAVMGKWFLAPESRNAPLQVDQLTHYVPISLGPPNPESFLTMAVEGERVFTSVMVNGRPRLSSIDVDSGEVQAIVVPDEISSNSLADISKDGSRLLLLSRQSTESEQPLWVVPSAGGTGRRIPGVLVHDATWMPDGAGILIATGNDLAEIGSNEDAAVPYAKLPGRAFWLRWSPDGKLLRFTLFDPVTHAASLWEMDYKSHTPRAISVPGLERLFACCGVWLPDGRSYVFQANDNLWQLTGPGRHTELLQLTNGPLRSLSPASAKSGSRIFFLGLEPPSGLQLFDAAAGEFRSAPAFLADANRIDYSRDGKWVAWTDIHEKLWRAHVDGSDRIRLTSDTLEVFLAHWSPDEKRLAVMARKPGGVWQIYLVDANGGKAEALLSETRNAADPGWSSDGDQIVFGREPDLMGKESGSHALKILRLSTHKIEDILNSENLFSPRWSPDGRWILALTRDQRNVMLYDVALRQWQRLISTSAADPVWSADSKGVYLHAFSADREPILRVEVPSGRVRTLADLGNFHNGEAANYFFGGVTPKGEPLVQPRVGTGNLYTLDLAKP